MLGSAPQYQLQSFRLTTLMTAQMGQMVLHGITHRLWNTEYTERRERGLRRITSSYGLTL